MKHVLIFLKIDLIVYSVKLNNAKIVKLLLIIKDLHVTNLLKINY